jgi:hypothetical protein
MSACGLAFLILENKSPCSVLCDFRTIQKILLLDHRASRHTGTELLTLFQLKPQFSW